MRAISYAKATRPSTLEALTIQIDEAETATAAASNGPRTTSTSRCHPRLAVPRDHPARSSTTSGSSRQQSPRDVVTVFIPEYVVGRWWEQLLHNQSALRLKARLLFEPGVMVTSVPWQLQSSDRPRRPLPGDLKPFALEGPQPTPGPPRGDEDRPSTQTVDTVR